MLLISGIASLAISAQAQNTKLFAFSAVEKGTPQWSSIHQLNASTGADEALVPDIRLQATIKSSLPNNTYLHGVAAALAFDEATQQLFYTTMHGNAIHAYNVVQKTVQSFYPPTFSSGGTAGQEGNVVTRMCAASNGLIYTLTNDGNSLCSFSPNNPSKITQHSALIDADKNGATSIHNQCIGWGGDMVADAFGTLYIITARGAVFTVNTSNLQTTYIATIKGLPANFTVNGAAVTTENDILLSCANQALPMHKVSVQQWQATELPQTVGFYNSSDLASNCLLFQQAKPARIEHVAKVTSYPNPITQGISYVNLTQLAAGAYTIDVTDFNGKAMVRKQVQASEKSIVPVQLPQAVPGIYWLRVTNAQQQVVHAEKWIVQ